MAAQRYATLDGIRGVAALAIVLLHLQRPGFQMPISTYAAVDLFFLMSGFVIARAYEDRILQTGAWGFVRARMIRLYPMVLAGLMIALAYFVAVFAVEGKWLAPPGDIARSLGAALLFLPSSLSPSGAWEQQALFPLNTPAWSLMFEVAVNLVYALILPWLSRRVLVFIVLASGLLLIAAQVQLNGLDLGWGWPSLWWGVPRVAFSFFLGVLIYRAKISRPSLPPVLIVAAAGLLFWAPPLLAVLVGFPLILIVATRPDEDQGSRVMAAMGALSYPLYAIHYPLLRWTGWLLAACKTPEAWFIPASLALVLLGAFLALKLWDEPVRRYLSRQV
jgi:peptidoglycan/LPS O-acetylase OafA/YrhL